MAAAILENFDWLTTAFTNQITGAVTVCFSVDH